MDNHLIIYQKNTKSITVLVSGLAHIATYSPYLSVKRRATDASTVIFKGGTVTDNNTSNPSTGTIIFSLTTTDTSLAPLDYTYDVTITGSGNKITLVKDIFTIADTVID